MRPLPFTGDKGEGSITRRHFIRRHPHAAAIFSIVGGKLTTYRSLSEEVVDLILTKLGKSSVKCTTDKVPLPGANTLDFGKFGKTFKQQCGLPEAISDRLLRVYGVRSVEVLKLTEADPSLGEVFDDETQAIAAEVIFAFRNEMAETLADCLLRRTMVGLNSTCGLNAIERAATIAKQYLGWSETRAEKEVAEYQMYVARFSLSPDLFRKGTCAP